MSRSVIIIDVPSESLALLATVIEENDQVVVLAPPMHKLETHAPKRNGKYKDHFRIKTEFWIPKDSIVGEDAIDVTKLTLWGVLGIPKSRVNKRVTGEKEVTNE